MEEQENEILALSSIYENDEKLFLSKESGEPSGEFYARQIPKDPLELVVHGQKPVIVSYLSPIILRFALPWDYPSTQSPIFTVSCHWLSSQQLHRLCKRLDEIWEDNKGQVILYDWFRFLEEEAFEFLGIKSPVNLHSVIPHLQNKPRPSRTLPSNLNGVKTTLSIQSNNSSSKGDTCKAKGKNDTSVCEGGLTEHSNNVSECHINCVDNSPSFVLTPEKAYGQNLLAKDVDDRVRQDYISADTLLTFLVNQDIEREQEEFDQSVVTCNVCFAERQGKKCMRFTGCRHSFCKECLKDYFHVQIRDGNVKNLTCMSERCESEALPAQVKELVTDKEYERYDTLLLQCTLDTMNDIVYCPRPQCQHPVIKEANSDMGHCPACAFAFCSLCKLTYHGRSPCRMKADDLKKLRDEYLKANAETKQFLERKYGKRAIKQAMEEIHSAEWLEKNAKMCPYCGTQIQKTDGCNKMTCCTCRSYFCWLCEALLSKNNPYSHYGPGSPCNEKLFEGMGIQDDQDWLDEEEEDEEEDDDGGQYLDFDEEEILNLITLM